MPEYNYGEFHFEIVDNDALETLLEDGQAATVGLLFGDVSASTTYADGWVYGWANGRVAIDESLAWAKGGIRGVIHMEDVNDLVPPTVAVIDERGLKTFRAHMKPVYDGLEEYYGSDIPLDI